MTTINLVTGLTVRARGERFTIIEMEALSGGLPGPLLRLRLRGLAGELRDSDIIVLHPIDTVEPDFIPDLSLDRIGRVARFRLLHDMFRLRLSPPGDILIGAVRSRIRFEPYQ